eukprot:m51a1_g8446 putative v-type proton atpase subunit e-like (1148) ;mRNA; f:385293-390887
MEDSKAQAQIAQMKGFILKEAEEKRDEILTKAGEECQIERDKTVKLEKQKIESEFKRKEKQATVQKRISFSHEYNLARLRVLKAQDEIVQALVERARSRLIEVPKDSGKYQKLLHDLIVQTLLTMKETQAEVSCREKDRSVVEGMLSSAAADYQKRTGRQVTLRMAPASQSLADSCGGGVMLTALDGRVRCANTLEARLQIAFEKKLPDIRKLLFPLPLRKTPLATSASLSSGTALPERPGTPPGLPEDPTALALAELVRNGALAAGEKVALGGREATVAADGSLTDAASMRRYASAADWAREAAGSDAWASATAAGKTLAAMLSEAQLENATPRSKRPLAEISPAAEPATKRANTEDSGSVAASPSQAPTPTKRPSSHHHGSGALPSKRVVKPTSQEHLGVVRYDPSNWRQFTEKEGIPEREWEGRAPVALGGREFQRAYCKTFDALYYDQLFITELFGRIPGLSGFIRNYIQWPVLLKISKTDRRSETSDYTVLRKLGVIKGSRTANLISLEGVVNMLRKLESSHKAAYSALVTVHDINSRVQSLRFLEDRRCDRSAFGSAAPHTVVVFPTSKGQDPTTRERDTPRNSSGSEDEAESARPSEGESAPEQFMYRCECGKSFKTSQGKAGHCHFCPRHQALNSKTHTPAPPESDSDTDTTTDEEVGTAPTSPSASQMLVEPMTPTSTPAKPALLAPALSLQAPEPCALAPAAPSVVVTAAPPAPAALPLLAASAAAAAAPAVAPVPVLPAPAPAQAAVAAAVAAEQRQQSYSSVVMPPPTRLAVPGIALPVPMKQHGPELPPRALLEDIDEGAAGGASVPASAFSSAPPSAPPSVSPSPSMEQAAGDEQPTATGLYECSCGRVFTTSQAKAGHCHYCKTHRSLHNNPILTEKDKKLKRGRKFLITPTGTPNPDTSGPPTPPSRSASPSNATCLTTTGPGTPHRAQHQMHHVAVAYGEAHITLQLQAAVAEAEQLYIQVCADRDALVVKISELGSSLSTIREISSQVAAQQQAQQQQAQQQAQQQQQQQQRAQGSAGATDPVLSAAATACARASRAPGAAAMNARGAVLSQYQPSPALFAAAFQSSLKLPVSSAAVAAAAVAALSTPTQGNPSQLLHVPPAAPTTPQQQQVAVAAPKTELRQRQHQRQ